MDDLVAFNRYHFTRSPTIKRTKWTVMFLFSVLAVAAALLFPWPPEVTRLTMVIVAVIFAGLVSLVFHYGFGRSLERQVRGMFREGNNKGMLGPHELEIDAAGIVEWTEVNELRQSWSGIERIEENDDYVLIYLSSIMAHVIPKRAVTFGEPEAFIAQAKQFWSAANTADRTGS